jgi:diacylglycerol O-acyltransferase
MDRNFDLANHVVPREAAQIGQPGAGAAGPRRPGWPPSAWTRKRPLWQIHLIEDYTGPDGVKGSAMIVRIHHCIADGIALISVTMSLVDGGAAPPERRKKAAAAAGPEDWIADTLLKPFTDITVKALGAVGEGAARSLGMLGDPKKGMEQGMSGSLDMAGALMQVLKDGAAWP